jgi:hypothetical protein
MAKSKWSRKDGAFFFDFDAGKIVKAIEKAGGNIKPAIENASKKGLPIIQREFQSYIAQHRRTGATEASLIDPSQVKFIWGKEAKKRFVGKTTKGKKGFTGGSVEVVSEDDFLFFDYGFDLDNGGLPALWLDIGTPKRAPRYGKVNPSFFVYYGVEKNLKTIHAIQKAELMKILEGLQ